VKLVWPVVALLALAIAGCTGSSTPVLSLPAPTPVPTLPGVASIGYAAEILNVGSIGVEPSISINEYALGSTTSLQSFSQTGGARIRFDPSGTLWFDEGGQFAGFRPDGSVAGTICCGAGALLSFDLSGNLYTQGSSAITDTDGSTYPALNVDLVGLGGAFELERSIAMTGFPCSAVADRLGNAYVTTCETSRNGPLYNSVMMYGPASNGLAVPLFTSTVANGPVAIDPSGNVYAAVTGGVGVWTGSFTSGAPTRTISVGYNITVFDLAADRNSNLYVVGRAAAATASTPTTLLFVPNGATTTATALQTGLIEYVAAPIQ
jgi:hypothetical protein